MAAAYGFAAGRPSHAGGCPMPCGPPSPAQREKDFAAGYSNSEVTAPTRRLPHPGDASTLHTVSRFPARVHILMASQAQLGLVIRRGPTDRVATLLWDRSDDTFAMGQWLKGRIYERRCDLSPSGKAWIYFAMNGKWDSEAKGAWSAIALTPYLKALTLMAKGDCWQGGGLWTGKNTYWLNDGYGHTTLRDTSSFQRDLTHLPQPYFGGECTGVYYHRLLRDGWSLVDEQTKGKSRHLDFFEKDIGKGWVLRKIAHCEIGAPVGKGCYWDEHQLLHRSDAICIELPHWEWAELDGKRLVWTSAGKLSSASLTHKGLADERELFDFNEMKFEAIRAPY